MAEDSSNGSTEYPELDVKKLHELPSEQQDRYLLTFTSDLARHVAGLDADGASAQQIYVKKELFKVINLSSPAPTRIIRNNLGRTFADIFGKGDRKLLIESINELSGILNSGKADKDFKTKHAAAHCLGAVFEAAGDSAISHAALASSSLLRLLKAVQNNTGFRGTIFKALSRVFKGVGPSADEVAVRDVWKQGRNSVANEKSLLVQASACNCLENLIRYTPYFDNSADFDKLLTAIWKAIDSSAVHVRHQAASCLAAALAKSYSDSPRTGDVPKVKKPKKSNKKKPDLDGDDELPERPDSPAPSKPATLLSFTIFDILRQLSNQYIKVSTSNRSRAGIAVCYMKVLRELGPSVVEPKYGQIAHHLFEDILSYPTVIHSRHRLLSARKFIQLILEEVVGQQLLGETGQLNAVRWLINGVLKDYPQMLKERPEPSKQALTAALSALTSLINSLGAATSAAAQDCRDALLQVLQHPSYTVQIHASACLRAFVLACPQQLLPCVTICMNSVNRELNLLTGSRQSPRRCVGFANGLSAALSTATLQPLYSSVDINSRVLSQATTLLKSSSSSDLRISSTQIQVAWILIGGLMTLGPTFVKIHLSQLLLLWKNALPKPLNKDNMVQRNLLELSFLAHVRECALGSILTFLEYNSRLLTLDVTKRLAAMLQNTAIFLSSLPQKKTTEDINQRLSPALQLQDFDLMVRRRVLQCYTKLVNLSPPGADETLLQTNLLPFAVASFADPESYTPSSISSSIASSAGTFESIWDIADNSGFGVTGLVRGFKVKPLPGEDVTNKHDHWLAKGDAETLVDQTILSPIIGALEHDSVTVYTVTADDTESPHPPATEVVNAAITLFATTLPLYNSKVQESILEQISSFFSSNSLARDPARKAAITANIAVALLTTLKVNVKDTTSTPGELRGDAIERVMQEFLHIFIKHPDQYIRNIASEALGRLSRTAGNIFTSREVKWLLDQIAETREPHVRAGCAIALGCIHSQLGGMAAGFHLKSIQQYLMSLASDPHPTVHFWALESLSRVADSAGLNFSSYVMETLGLIAQLYVADTHNEEAPLPGASNLEVELPTQMAIVRCVDSIINVLGPDLQDMSKARDMIMTLIGLFQQEGNTLMLVQTLRCQENLALYAPGYMRYTEYVKYLQSSLQSESVLYRDIALNGLYNLMRADANAVIKTADPGLDDQLWNILNQTPNQRVVHNIIRNWLEQTSLTETGLWVQRCQTVLTRTLRKEAKKAEQQTSKSAGMPDLQDEEVAGFAAAAGVNQEDTNGAQGATLELLKWQVRTFAMECLEELMTTVAKEAINNDEAPAVQELQQKVADVVRIAFSASTSGVVQLRIQGLKIVDHILKIFGKTPDPDFPEAPLLEQYQAQIGSALTPAFAADSSPELAAEAVSVCASFIATGIVTDVDRMGRILKLLVSALENFSDDSETATIGELKGLSSNAQVMVKMAVFSAWAELQIASAEQKYLVDVLKPHIVKLTPLWLSSLREYARLRFEPDVSTTGGPASLSGNLDTVYAALNRETLLKFYQQSWLNLVDAIASLIDEDSEFVFDALDGKTEADSAASGGKPSDINYRDEPVAFFFVLFGLAFEALVGRPGDRVPSHDQILNILQALKKILRPAVSGHAIYQEVIFSETMDMLDRMVLTEGLGVQSVIVDIARNLCIGHPSARSRHDGPVEEERLSEDIDQLFELTRIIILVLAGLIPGLSENKGQVRNGISDEATIVLTSALSALVDAAEVFPTIIKTDLHACILHVFATILATGFCQAAVVPQALPIFKRFVTSLTRVPPEQLQETRSQIRGSLNRFLAILAQAQQRESEYAVPCEKNSLLATTILITSAAPVLESADPLLKRFITVLGDCLGNRLTSRVAANCCRSVLLGPRKGAVEEALVAHLLPHVFAFLTHPSDVEGLDETRSLLTQTLTSFAQTLRAPQQGAAMALIIPTLLARASREGEATYKETALRLLELAGAAQAEFRAIVGKMDDEQKQFMEGVIKNGASKGNANRPQVEREGSQEPSIALKMNFGS